MIIYIFGQLACGTDFLFKIYIYVYYSCKCRLFDRYPFTVRYFPRKTCNVSSAPKRTRVTLCEIYSEKKL